MPHITHQLTNHGPVIRIILGVSDARRQALEAAGQDVPARIEVAGLIDTGASHTCIDKQTIIDLEIPIRGSTPAHTASTGETPDSLDEYEVGLYLPHPDGYQAAFPALQVMAIDLGHHGFHALIGRDVLAKSLFVYDGTIGLFCLSF